MAIGLAENGYLWTN